MKLQALILAGAGALALLSFALPAAAAPSVGADLKTAASENSTVDQVYYRTRHCWRHHGHLHCRYHRYGYAPYYDDGYYGYGFGPSIGLSFGGGGHHGGHHHRR
jgi:hypothetical protein